MSPRHLSSVLAASLLVASAPAARSAPEVWTFTSEAVVVEPRFGSQRNDLSTFHTVGEVLRLGGVEHAVRLKDGALTIETGLQKGARKTLRKAETIEIALAAADDGPPGRVSLHFRPAPGGEGWEYANVTARDFDLGGAPLRIVDVNGDGRYDGFGQDGVTRKGLAMLIPLTRKLVVGRADVRIDKLTPDGAKLTARMRLMDGTPRQLTALETINDCRLRTGLPPVRLDPELSKACTAHAEYLDANDWSGYSNPHEEDEEKPGYTEAGAAVAPKALIMQANVRFAIDSFWRTYYHRFDLLDPGLERIGVADGPRWIVVIDAKNGVTNEDTVEAGWNDPILSPANGQTDFETRFCSRGEAPPPVLEPWVRGNPLIATFPMDDRFITAFEGRLVKITDDGEEPVPTLTARQAHAVYAFGLVPRKALESGATYRVTWSFRANDEPESVTATFSTR